VTDVTTDPADALITLRPVTTDAARAGVHSDQDADKLRDAMVDEVIARRERLGLVPPREVEAALRTVPRHLFAPGVPLDKAYANDSIVTKRNERGVGISAVSAHLPDLLSTWEDGPADDWWFLRYRDPEPHLRLRIRLRDARTYGAAIQRLGAWADRVQRLGLLRNIVLDTYYPEVGRYGTGAAMQAAEAVFAADSTVTIAQLTMTGGGNPHPHAVIAASFTDLATAFTGGVTDGLRWLLDHVKHSPAPALARAVRDQAMCLADFSDDWAALRTLPGGELLVQAWARRRSALAAYRTHLTDAEGPEPNRVLASLLHLHHARMIGIDSDSERVCLRLARAAALGWVVRNDRSTPSPSTSPIPTRQPPP